MDLEQFLAKVPQAYSAADRESFAKAYALAQKAHAGQTRASGQPYLAHCVGVANILMGMEVAPSMVIAGLLHDTVLDGHVTIEQIRTEFGETVASFVEDLTRITSLPQISRADQHEEERVPLPPAADSEDSHLGDNVTETIRKMLLAIGDDIRVVIIKLADRLNNMRALNALPPDRQKKIAQETLDIFAPLANRLGIWQMKWELEDLGFRYTNPERYNEIANSLSLRRNKRQEEINNIISTLQKLMEQSEVKATISGRPKHIYSIYRKMQRKGLGFDAIRDLRAVRIIVDDVATCYKVLGIIHMHYQPIPGEFDDYIAVKKPNNYQSLHTSIIFPDGKPVEVQIRTYEMHQNAEFGVAAHWRYKEKGAQISNAYEQKVSNLRGAISYSQTLADDQELIEAMRSDVFRDRVYALTPKGDAVELPFGSTPIDFAYQVHTDIGHRCRGAKVNGKLVTLDYQLKTGDQVEILAAKRGGPSRDWLNPALGMVKSSRTKQKIKQWFKQQDREQNLVHGKEILEKEFKRLGITQFNLQDLVEYTNVKTLDDLYVGLGSGDITIGRLINRVAEIQKENQPPELTLVPETPSKGVPHDTVTVMGLSGMATTMARCCQPMPGDPIIGYITRGRGATIHRSDCPNILRVKDKERLISVGWGTVEQTYPIPIQIKAYDRQGLMADISTILSSEPVRLVDMSMTTRQNLVKVNLVIEISGLGLLSRVLARLENLPNVIEAIRVRPG
ncbi:MAG: bifunctional (p)ppGpp synthetase/guanosine-3',5'-bis(diphosphate) 3'-pyrophosphohydrolase [Anaerolineaceae bacterium]|nr:bifunctional (p)ppGpp synthetase/guanosine-3',5'-bis(diphosphate) 3'-pyrophosphohydrolase [Anaerolineaceae bacterium]